ncbi:MAG: hypothetical protein AAF840_05025 [Bacteroidota bacterium]
MQYLLPIFLSLSISTSAQVSLQQLHPFAPDNIDFRTTSRGVNFNGKLIFPANTDSTGTKLWISDGTQEGTHQLADLNPGRASS